MGTGVPRATPAPDAAGPQAAEVQAAPRTPLPTNIPAAGAMPEPVAPPDPYVGHTLTDRYFVEKKLGEGGMGSVYQARHVILDKPVALKVLHEEFSRKADLVERFLLEAKSASRIRHENVIDISDYGQTPSGAVFFAMEFLQGRDLHDLVARAKINGESLPWTRTRPIFLQICAALSAAHGKGIVHRDLKPENIFLVDWLGHKEFVKLLDFGIAKVTDVDGEGDVGNGGDRKLTKTGMLFGTPEYMSPEQARGDKVDKRVDVYAMGCILYQLITGDVPFRAENFMGILSMHLTEAPAPITPAQLAAVGAPEALASVVMKALAKDRDARFQSIDEFAAAVTAADGGTGVAVPSATSAAPIGSAGTATVTTSTASQPKAEWTGSVQIVSDARDASGAVPIQGKKSSTGPLIAIIALVVLAGAAAAGFMLTRSNSESGADIEAADVAAGPRADTANSSEEPLPAMVTIAISSTPKGARAIDVSNGQTGQDLGVTPLDLKLPGSRTTMRLRLEMTGYRSQILQFVLDQDVEHSIDLKRASDSVAGGAPDVVVLPQKRKPRRSQTPATPTTRTKPDDSTSNGSAVGKPSIDNSGKPASHHTPAGKKADVASDRKRPASKRPEATQQEAKTPEDKTPRKPSAAASAHEGSKPNTSKPADSEGKKPDSDSSDKPSKEPKIKDPFATE